MDHIEFMRKIGAKGGQKRAFHPDRRIFAREAGRISWSPKGRAKRLSNKRAKRQYKDFSREKITSPA